MTETRKRFPDWIEKIPKGGNVPKDILTKAERVKRELQKMDHPLPHWFGEYITALLNNNLRQAEKARKKLIVALYYATENEIAQ